MGMVFVMYLLIVLMVNVLVDGLNKGEFVFFYQFLWDV